MFVLEIAHAEEHLAQERTWVAYLAPWAPYAMCCYLLGLSLMSGRLVFSTIGLRRLRLSIRTPSEELTDRVAKLSMQIGLRVRPVVDYCDRVAVPFVTGLVKPIILMPTSAMTGMTAAEIDSILVHELAHLRRGDMWINYLQRFVETLLFFHPAVWYVSRIITVERENCCDDIVLKHSESQDYASALVRLAEKCLPSNQLAPIAALAATGRPSQLKRRVQRILGETPRNHLPRRSYVWLFMGIAVIGTFSINLRAETDAPETKPRVDEIDAKVGADKEIEAVSLTVVLNQAGNEVRLESSDLSRIAAVADALRNNPDCEVDDVAIKSHKSKTEAVIRGTRLTSKTVKGVLKKLSSQRVEQILHDLQRGKQSPEESSEAIQLEMARCQKTLEQLNDFYLNSHPEIVRLNQQVDTLKRKLDAITDRAIEQNWPNPDIRLSRPGSSPSPETWLTVKVVGHQKASAGSLIAYDIHVTNNGGTNAKGVNVWTSKSEDLSLFGGSPRPSANEGSAGWYINTLAEGQTKRFRVEFRCKSDNPRPLVALAKATNATQVESSVSRESSPIAIEISGADPYQPRVGQKFKHLIRVENRTAKSTEVELRIKDWQIGIRPLMKANVASDTLKGVARKLTVHPGVSQWIPISFEALAEGTHKFKIVAIPVGEEWKAVEREMGVVVGESQKHKSEVVEPQAKLDDRIMIEWLKHPAKSPAPGRAWTTYRLRKVPTADAAHAIDKTIFGKTGRRLDIIIDKNRIMANFSNEEDQTLVEEILLKLENPRLGAWPRQPLTRVLPVRYAAVEQAEEILTAKLGKDGRTKIVADARAKTVDVTGSLAARKKAEEIIREMDFASSLSEEESEQLRNLEAKLRANTASANADMVTLQRERNQLFEEVVKLKDRELLLRAQQTPKVTREQLKLQGKVEVTKFRRPQGNLLFPIEVERAMTITPIVPRSNLDPTLIPTEFDYGPWEMTPHQPERRSGF